MTCVIKMYKIVLLIAVVCLIFGELNGYSNVYNESKCATVGKNETGRLHCKEHDHIHIKKIWTDEDKCIFGKSSNISYTIRSVSCISNSSCDVKYETNISSKYLNIVYKCADCLPMMWNTTAEITCRKNMIIEIYDVWITNEQEPCPSYKQTHKRHTFNNYILMKSAFCKKCNWKSKCEIYNNDQLITASYMYSVYYQCKAENKSLDLGNVTSRQGIYAGVVTIVGILVILCILVAVFISRRQTTHSTNKKTHSTRTNATNVQSKLTKEHQNRNQNSGISNSIYTELVSSIEYAYAILSAEPGSIAQNGNQDKGISNSTYIELVSSDEYSYAIPSAEPDFIVEQNDQPNEYQNGNQNSDTPNSPYEMASSVQYSYDMSSAGPDSIAENSEVQKEHLNRNSGISNSPYEMSSSVEYSYDMMSAEPDSIAEQYKVPNEHPNRIQNSGEPNSPYEMASSIESSYDMTGAALDSNAEQYEVQEENQNGGKNNAIKNSPYEMAASIDYAYFLTSAEPDSFCVKNTDGSNEHLYAKGKRTTGKLSFDIENPIDSTYSHLIRDAGGSSDMTHTSHTRVQETAEGDYDLSCNRFTEDEYNISENYNVSFNKDSDYNEI